MSSHGKWDAPASNNTVRVRMIDTTGQMVLHARFFLEPIVPGHELMNGPDMAFLIENKLSGKKALFDLGTRKDYWNLPPTILNRFDKLCVGVKFPKDIKDILSEKNIPLESINDMIWSHSHWDHTGDTTLFPSTTNLVYGPGVSGLKPGYPSNPDSPIAGVLFENRRNIEIDFPSDGLKIGGFPAHDFYGDGSFYLLSTPGHAQGHLCALARTTPDTFILMGGDVCHFPGHLRPNKAYPMPDTIPDGVLDHDPRFGSPCPASFFLDEHPQIHHHHHHQEDSQQSHPQDASSEGIQQTPKQAKQAIQQQSQTQKHSLSGPPSTTPFYALSTAKGSAYDTPNPTVAQNTINTLIANFDSNQHVFVALAHDPALPANLPTLNEQPDADLNDWFAQGWKDKCYWTWLNEVSRKGKAGRGKLVDGWWRDGKRWATAREMLDAYQDVDQGDNGRSGGEKL